MLLLDPMLGRNDHFMVLSWYFIVATGGSVVKAVEVLKEHGVQQDKIIFLNLISAPEGLEYFTKACPQV